MDGENNKIRQDAAMHILKGTGLLYAESLKPTGPTAVNDIEDEELEKENISRIFSSINN